MKLIHVSDLHLGKKVGNFSMIENQKVILDQIYDAVIEEEPQALLIAGDIYDKAVPSTEAVSLFDDFLVRLSRIKNLSVFVLSGNHDSAERIAFGGRLIDETGIHMSPVYRGEVRPIMLNDEFGPAAFYMLPFIKPALVRHYFDGEEVNDYSDAVRCAIDHMGVDTSIRNVLLSHQAVIGSERSASELNIGGLDSMSAEPYMIFDYVALGHIHKAQNVKKDHIRYCGAPLKYDFGECDQEKSMTIVELGAKGDVSVRTKQFVPKDDFIRVEGLFADICEAHRGVPCEDYVEVILKDEQDVPDAFRQLQNYFPKMIHLRYDNKRTSEKRKVRSAADVRERSAFDIFSELFETMNNQPMTADQTAYMEQVIRDIEEAQG